MRICLKFILKLKSRPYTTVNCYPIFCHINKQFNVITNSYCL